MDRVKAPAVFSVTGSYGLLADLPCDWKEGPVKADVDLSGTLLTRNDEISNTVGLALKQRIAG